MKPEIPNPTEPVVDYNVGYRRPPAHAQFKKGHSGNPKGRARGSSNVATLLDEAVRATVTVIEGGRRVKKPKLSVAFTQVANKSAAGDSKAFGHLLRLLPMLPAAEVQGLITPDMATDRELAKKLAQRFAVRKLPDPEAGGGAV